MKRKSLLLIPLALFALVAAAPTAEPEDMIRRANAAFLQGDADAADALYAAAEERTGDPGLVSFNKAAVLFQRGEFYAAEVHYARTLDDKSCPADRAVKAWFNRGTCLLRRGGSPSVFRSAIACFERSLEANATDGTLKADARHNLELAKLLWAEANKKASKPDNPNDLSREDKQEPDPAPPAPKDPGGDDPGATVPGKNDVRPMPTPMTGQTPKTDPNGVKNPMGADVPGLQPLPDESTPQKLSPEDTREYLRRTEARLRDERRKMPRPPDRPGVRDW